MQLRQDHELVTRGVYRRIRHPTYAAIFLWDVAQGLLLENWLAGWSALLTFALLYAYRVGRAERLLRKHFGHAYDDYVRSSGRLLPRISRQP